MFLMGDIHGAWGDADNAYDRARERFGKPDMLVQVGDYGYYPHDGMNPITLEPDPYHFPNKSGLWEREFDHPVAFIDGNHEDHEALRKDGPMLTHGTATWEYLERGTCRDGVLYVGGASSVDKDYRLRWGHPWSELENLTREEADLILDANHKNVKVVISHTCPSSFDMHQFCNPHWGGENKDEISRQLLQEILEKYQPKYWYFGHWHRSGSGRVGDCRWQCLNINEVVYIDTEEM